MTPYFIKNICRALGVDTRALYQRISGRCIEAAVREQGLIDLRGRLREIVPDVADQYTEAFDAVEFGRLWESKMRSLHAFQIEATMEAMRRLGSTNLTIADVGDSSGNHSAYLRAVAPAGQIGRMVSVNLDPVAVDKINEKGGEAMLCPAENLGTQGLRPDLMLLFETLEHLTDPLRFLHSMIEHNATENLLITVPYRRSSRFGGQLIRYPIEKIPAEITAEKVHMFELCPEDWQLLARLAGYRTEFCRFYRQYPRRSFYRLLAPLWRRTDFEGFIALFLRRDTSLSARYTNW